ncbi:hypothetical protein AWN76_004245 [Rhodothermaceae bacterium RA]|nr:hypothetical protein AWN76_004245 [Rhodothermaceae bacterium RA]
MRIHWIIGATLIGLASTLIACEDPSNVGIGLVGEEGGTPFIVDIPGATVSAEPTRDLTGNAARFLTGSVFDPLLGTTTATAYVDFFATASADFQASTVDTVVLRLKRDYLYGDTTATITLMLRAMSEDWSAEDVPADTTLEPGDVILEGFTFSAADTLIEVPLPSDWVAANDEVFRSDDFLTAFNGFQLTTTAGNVVVGFNRDDSSLLAVTASEDTTIFNITKNLSTYVQQADGADLPPDVLLIRDGTGPMGRLTFDFARDSTRQQFLNRVVVQLPAVEDVLAANTPSNFHRPLLSTLNLRGVDETSGNAATLVSSATLSDGVVAFESADLRTIVQRLLFDEAPITHFTIEAPATDNTLNVLLVRIPPAEDAPRARLTLTPTDN